MSTETKAGTWICMVCNTGSRHREQCRLHTSAPAMLEALKAVCQAYEIKDVVKALDTLRGLTPLIEQTIAQVEGHTT